MGDTRWIRTPSRIPWSMQPTSGASPVATRRRRPGDRTGAASCTGGPIASARAPRPTSTSTTTGSEDPRRVVRDRSCGDGTTPAPRQALRARLGRRAAAWSSPASGSRSEPDSATTPTGTSRRPGPPSTLRSRERLPPRVELRRRQRRDEARDRSPLSETLVVSKASYALDLAAPTEPLRRGQNPKRRRGSLQRPLRSRPGSIPASSSRRDPDLRGALLVPRRAHADPSAHRRREHAGDDEREVLACAQTLLLRLREEGPGPW